jgi:hypothetical protein
MLPRANDLTELCFLASLSRRCVPPVESNRIEWEARVCDRYARMGDPCRRSESVTNPISIDPSFLESGSQSGLIRQLRIEPLFAPATSSRVWHSCGTGDLSDGAVGEIRQRETVEHGLADPTIISSVITLDNTRQSQEHTGENGVMWVDAAGRRFDSLGLPVLSEPSRSTPSCLVVFPSAVHVLVVTQWVGNKRLPIPTQNFVRVNGLLRTSSRAHFTG